MSRSRYADLREPTSLLPRVPGRSWPLWTRPLGYGALSVIWFMLLVVAAIVAFAALPLALSAQVDGGPLTALPLFRRTDWIATLVVIIVVAAPILGVISVLLLAATLGMWLSAATLFFRSLRPRYADEQLSFSVRSRGETVGPITTAATGTSIALVPIRMTRWTRIVTIVRFFGWIPNLGLFLIGAVWGIGYLLTVGWILWPAEGTTRAICAIATAVGALALLALVWRLRRRYPRIMPTALAPTPYATSWPAEREARPARVQRRR